MKRLKLLFLIWMMMAAYLPALGQSVSKLARIVIDAGHGGHDLGAPGLLVDEKELTLSIALRAGAAIKKVLPGVDVIYTRTADVFVPLHQRAALANSSDADLFISIHCNSGLSPTAFGSESYVMGLHKTQENFEVAKKENAPLLAEKNYAQNYDGFNPDNDEDYIMLHLLQNNNMERSIMLANLVQQQLRNTASMYDRGVKQAGFVVLYLTTMPGVLIETGFVSNPAEEKFLTDTTNQQNIANAIALALTEYEQTLLPTPETAVPADTITLPKEKITKYIYRIQFAVNPTPELPEDKHWDELENLWFFKTNGGYLCTFGETSTVEQAQQLIDNYLQKGILKKKHLQQLKIIKCSETEHF
ncbi:MAG: N-acetylmuramoyl-L-alanine amidase [Clostridia bacterium]|nr:N-acetylmuramoyl-L-alanine amidase [Clostridia bacterium]